MVEGQQASGGELVADAGLVAADTNTPSRLLGEGRMGHAR
eukprot:COSAG01_NODE_2443_length_7689_cov_5.414229_11_plen_40_part_00